jgi:phosphotransferase system enzyme I (PtsI)
MVEVPAAVVGADILAKEAAFFSIGTNDLIQYSMAIDRTNESVSYLYEPLHPVILRQIHQVIQAGHAAGRWVGMCGEMAGMPEAIPILLGLGLDEFSMNASAIPEAKALIRRMHEEPARQLARRALECETAGEVRELVRAFLANL